MLKLTNTLVSTLGQEILIYKMSAPTVDIETGAVSASVDVIYTKAIVGPTKLVAKDNNIRRYKYGSKYDKEVREIKLIDGSMSLGVGDIIVVNNHNNTHSRYIVTHIMEANNMRVLVELANETVPFMVDEDLWAISYKYLGFLDKYWRSVDRDNIILDLPCVETYYLKHPTATSVNVSIKSAGYNSGFTETLDLNYQPISNMTLTLGLAGLDELDDGTIILDANDGTNYCRIYKDGSLILRFGDSDDEIAWTTLEDGFYSFVPESDSVLKLYHNTSLNNILNSLRSTIMPNVNIVVTPTIYCNHIVIGTDLTIPTLVEHMQTLHTDLGRSYD